MLKNLPKTIARQCARVRPGLVLVVVFLALLNTINVLVVNQKVILNLFYIPVVFAAWYLSRRDAVSVAILAAVMVLAYALFIPGKLGNPKADALFCAELGTWGGILIATAYLVATLRLWTQRAVESLQQAYAGVLAILSKLMQTVDADTEAHSVRVSAWSVRIAEGLGLDRSIVEETRIAGLLHDVGKVDVSIQLLRKAAALSQDERARVQEHASRGGAMVRSVGGMLGHIADAIESHHEKYDGSGYTGLKGEEIPMVARIIAVADAFDAMLSDRPYRKGMGVHEAIDGVITCAGSHFDPGVVAKLQEIVSHEGERAIGAQVSVGRWRE